MNDLIVLNHSECGQFWVDAHGNRWTKAKWPRHMAIYAAESFGTTFGAPPSSHNTDCYGLNSSHGNTDCWFCSNTARSVGCTGLMNAFRCEHCYGGMNMGKCQLCFHVMNAAGRKFCLNVFNAERDNEIGNHDHSARGLDSEIERMECNPSPTPEEQDLLDALKARHIATQNAFLQRYGLAWRPPPAANDPQERLRRRILAANDPDVPPAQPLPTKWRFLMGDWICWLSIFVLVYAVLAMVGVFA